jgi:polyribonucleotide nucleotidyltransferase
LKVGDKIKVKLIEVDKKTGKYKLSHRVLLPKPEGFVERPQRERPERPNNNRPSNNRNNSERPKPQKPERPLDEDFYI